MRIRKMKSFDGIIRRPKSMSRTHLDIDNVKVSPWSRIGHWPIGAIIVLAAILINSVTLLSAFEAHVINVTATIERRLDQLDDIVENEKIREVAVMGTVELATSTVPITTTEVKNATTTIIEAIEATTTIDEIPAATDTTDTATTTETTTDQPQPTLPETVETPVPESEALPDVVDVVFEPEPVLPPDEVVSSPDEISAPEPAIEISTVDN